MEEKEEEEGMYTNIDSSVLFLGVCRRHAMLIGLDNHAFLQRFSNALQSMMNAPPRYIPLPVSR